MMDGWDLFGGVVDNDFLQRVWESGGHVTGSLETDMAEVGTVTEFLDHGLEQFPAGTERLEFGRRTTAAKSPGVTISMRKARITSGVGAGM